MRLYSTNDKTNQVDLKQAVLKSLPADRGLYMPIEIPEMDGDWFGNISRKSFTEIASEVAQRLIGSYIPSQDLDQIISRSITFPAPVVPLSEGVGSLELWHGPSLAFKDFGARFMASLMSYFISNDDKHLTILVATSGDTGGAVAAGFYETEGVDVIILFPSGKVSPLQEKQLTTLGKNITALEIDGTFDDCQAIVKEAFLDPELNQKYNLSSANSINIARLIPQSFYYFEAWKQVQERAEKIIFSVPSGNFGNLTAGVLAQQMGLPIHKFIAATNANNVVPKYLDTGQFIPEPSIATISNAMDVGNPSNFPRLLALHENSYEKMRENVLGFWLNDKDTKTALKEIHKDLQYVADPHGAIGYKSIQHHFEGQEGVFSVFLETAHPAKFLEIMEETIGNISIPNRLQALASKEKVAAFLPNDFKTFKEHLM